MIDAAIEPPDRPLIDPEKPERETLKTGPPSGDEWLDFFSRIVLKVGINLYTDLAFRGVDESQVTEEDLRRIQVKKQERDTIARPFAEFATKNKMLRKHGREVVALTDSLESLMTLGILLRRINRVAAKYKRKGHPVKARAVHVREEATNGDNGQATGNAGIGGTGNGRVPNGYSLFNPGSG